MHAAFRLLIVSAFAVAAITPTAFAGAGHHHDHGDQLAQGAKEPSIAAKKLNDRLTMLYGVDGFTGGNVLVSNGPDGMLVIDAKLGTMGEKLMAALGQIADPKSMKFLINTHWHADHTGNNKDLGKQAIIVAHTNLRQRLSSDQRVDLFKMEVPASPQSALPVITYDDSVSIHFNGEEVQLLHTPASHTDTDTVVYFTNSGVLHMGDLFFNGLFPFVDIQNGGNVDQLIGSIEMILETFPADTTLVPGHGPLATMEDLKTYYRMLLDTTTHVEDMVKAGKSLDEIKAAGVPKEWENWAWRLDAPTWNGIIFSSFNQ